MKTRNLLLTSLLSLGMLAACTTDDDPGNNPGNNDDGNTAYAQIAISVSANSVGTRATVDDPSEGETGDQVNANDSENNVSKVTVVLADVNTDIAQYVYNFSTANTDFFVGSDKTDFATKPFEVPQGKYHVYVLANYGDNGISANVAPGFDMKQEIDISDASKLYTTNSFLMANDGIAKESDFTGTASGKEVDGDLKDKAEGATLHKVEVNIERVVSKVTFAADASHTNNQYPVEDANGEKIATATVNGVALINTNQKMFLIREAKTALNKPDDITSWIYPTDPNYNTVLKGGNDASTEKTWLEANFANASADADDFKDITGEDAAVFYCPENTMAAAAQQNGQTTGVVYKVTWAFESNAKPYTELSKDGSDAYSKIFAAILKLSSGKDDDITEQIFTSNPAEGTAAGTFYAYNNLIFKNKNAAILYKCIVEATGTIDNDKASSANTAFTSAKSAALPAAIDEYTGGVNYYPVWIKHNPDGGNMEQDKYGVVRNHWYELTVTGISNLGNSKPTFDKPEDPGDAKVANIQVAAKIKPWTLVKQDVEL